jgi:cytochrome P450
MSSSPVLANWFSLSLPMRDGVDHRRLRSLLQPSFSRRRIEEIEALVVSCVDRRLDAALRRGHLDVVRDLAGPLPMDLSFEMLGIPEGDRQEVAAWVSTSKSGFLVLDGGDGDTLEADVDALAAYMAASVVDASPDGDGLLAVLARASSEWRLSNDELVAYIFLLLVNGLDTLTAAVADAAYELVRTNGPGAAAPKSRAEASGFFEEVLRYYSPVRFSARQLTEDLELGGHHMTEGSVVVLFFAAANRDPRHFDRPGTFEPTRPSERHLAYGHGVHQCIGRHLASLTGAIVLERLSSLGDRLSIAVDPEDLEWSTSLLYHTLDELPLAIAR